MIIQCRLCIKSAWKNSVLQTKTSGLQKKGSLNVCMNEPQVQFGLTAAFKRESFLLGNRAGLGESC